MKKKKKKGTCILTSPKFEFRECKLTFLDDVEVAKLMHQENLLEIGILFMSENIICTKCVTASSIYGKELAIHENQAKGLKAEKNGGDVASKAVPKILMIRWNPSVSLLNV